MQYFEEEIGKDGANLRVYKQREDVDLVCTMSGKMPQKTNEIALDRMFAKNANLSVGDTITLNNKNFLSQVWLPSRIIVVFLKRTQI